MLTVTVQGETVEYSLSDLEALGSETFRTTTIWSDGEQVFTGLPLVTLLSELGVEDGTLMARAINDYAVEVPVSDGVENGPILAHHRNGEPMSVRDKGPLWLVYPYDTNPEYRSEVIYSRSIWQLDRIEILP
ncbi:MAG: oxidoreductase [Roseovarius confluentis]